MPRWWRDKLPAAVLALAVLALIRLIQWMR